MVSELKFLFSRSPSYLIFHVTNRCNFNCSHCFNHKIKEREIEELSLDEINRISRHLGHIKYLTLAGGEPMMRSDLNEIGGIFYRNNGLHILNIVTNGWFTDRVAACVKSLLKNYPLLKVNVGVSVDGPEPIHDDLRHQPGSYKRALDTILSLKTIAGHGLQNRLFIMACGTYHTRNAGTIAETAEFFARQIKVPYYAALIRGDAREPALKNVDIDHYRQVREQIQKLIQVALPRDYPFRRIRLAVDKTVADIVYNSYKHDRGLVTCRAGEKGFVLTADGGMPLCELLDIKLGNIRDVDYDPMAILRSRHARQAIKEKIKGKCHCTWECFQTVNVVFNPKLYPNLAWKAFKLVVTEAVRRKQLTGEQ
jgi:MoaA/NifB/PqqE/SkfB family radical SAM enzyme